MKHLHTVAQFIARTTMTFLWLAPVGALACDELIGDWSLQMRSGTPAWMSINQTEGSWDVKMRLYVGSDGPHTNVTMTDGRLTFKLRQNKKVKDSKIIGSSLTTD